MLYVDGADLITALLFVIGIVLSLIGTVFQVQFPVLPGLWSLSIFGIGLFFLSTALSSFFRSVSDMVGPFWFGVFAFTVGGVTFIIVDRVLIWAFKIDLIGLIVKAIGFVGAGA